LRGWIRRVTNRKLTCFNRFIGTLNTHFEEITNYFVNRQTSGFVEGLNNKLKVLKRRCYGILNLKHFIRECTWISMVMPISGLPGCESMCWRKIAQRHFLSAVYSKNRHK